MQSREPTVLMPPSNTPPNPDSPVPKQSDPGAFPGSKKGFPKRASPTSNLPTSPKVITNQLLKLPTSPNNNTAQPSRPFPGSQVEKTAVSTANSSANNKSTTPQKNRVRKQSENNILFDLKLFENKEKWRSSDPPLLEKIVETTAFEEREKAFNKQTHKLKQRKGSCNLQVLPVFGKAPEAPAFLKMRKNSEAGPNTPESPLKRESKLTKKKSQAWLEQKNFQFQKVAEDPQEQAQQEPQSPSSPSSPSSPVPKIKLRKASSDNDHRLMSPAFLTMKKQRSSLPQRGICIEHFKVLKQLGKGTFGRVVLAMEKTTGMMCAIKIISKREVKEGEMVQQLCRELKIQMYANHPHIVKLYGFFQDLLHFYIIMECAMDGHLSKLIKSKKQPMPQNEAATYTSQICKAFAHLHSHKVIHRDMKPQNVILHEGIVKLADFGWSVKINEQLRNTFCGTPVYLSPEQLSGEQYDESVDVWTIGMTLYEMLYGRNPFGITCKEQLVRIVDDEVNFEERAISPAARDFIQRCLKKRSSDRAKVRELLQHEFLKGRKEEVIELEKK